MGTDHFRHHPIVTCPSSFVPVLPMRAQPPGGGRLASLGLGLGLRPGQVGKWCPRPCLVPAPKWGPSA